MQLRMIARRSREGSLTILGDVAQATGAIPYRRWEELLPHLPHGDDAVVEELRHAYRVPREIMELALPLLDTIAPDVAPPISYRTGAAPPTIRRVAAEHLLAAAFNEAARLGAAGGLLAVIAPEELAAEAPAGDLWDGIPLLTPREAKGLEFDHVVVVEPALIAAHEQGLRELYVALTRPTKTLVVVHAQPLPAALRRVAASTSRLPDGSVPRRRRSGRDLGDRRLVGQHDRERAQPGRPLRRLRGTAALPGVAAQVMVVAACAQERRLRPELRHQIEAEQVPVEGDRLVDVGDAQVDVAHRRPVRQPGEGSSSLGALAEQVVEVERPACPSARRPLPQLPRPVGVDLDPVVVGVAEVERLADGVVRRSGQLDAARVRRARASCRGRRAPGRAVRNGTGRCTRRRAARRAPRRGAGARSSRRRASPAAASSSTRARSRRGSSRATARDRRPRARPAPSRCVAGS